jgi:hypothetical protein
MQTNNNPTTEQQNQDLEGSAPKSPEAHQKAVLKSTSEEWRKKHRDFKTTIKGQRYILAMTDRGTSLVPVEVVKKL